MLKPFWRALIVDRAEITHKRIIFFYNVARQQCLYTLRYAILSKKKDNSLF